MRRPVHWVSNFEITEAVQPVAPIKGILRTLRSNQWLVLSRSSAEEKTEFFPFRKRELVERLADTTPLSIASEVLKLPEHGATVVEKRVWSVDWGEDQVAESSRMAWVDERGTLLSIGVPRYDLGLQRGITAELRSELSHAVSKEEIAVIEGPNRELIGSERKPKETKKAEEEAPSLIVPVFYATDRKRDPNSQTEDLRFTSERAPNEAVSLGVCSVSIPKTHQIGKLERPPKWKIWARPRRNEHIMLLSTIELSDEAFWKQLNASIVESRCIHICPRL
jgi:hypothetical protein